MLPFGMTMFDGVTLPCTKPEACKCRSPSATDLQIATGSYSLPTATLDMAAASEQSPSSIATYDVDPSCCVLKSLTMFG